MKKTLLILTGLILSNVVMVAQIPKFMELPPDVRAKTHTEWMINTLKLNPDLFNKIYPINLQFANEVEPIKSDGISKFKKIKIIKDADGKRLKEFRTFLTADQVETYIQKRKELFEQEQKNAKATKKAS
jgi:hypothetical protein